MKEAAKLGFTQAIILKANKPRHPIAGMEIIAVGRMEEAVERMRCIPFHWRLRDD